MTWFRNNGAWKNLFLVSLLLAAASFFWPWFCMSPGVIDGSLGIGGGGLFVVFLCFFYGACYLGLGWRSRVSTIVMEVLLVALVLLVISAFFVFPIHWGWWRRRCAARSRPASRSHGATPAPGRNWKSG